MKTIADYIADILQNPNGAGGKVIELAVRENLGKDELTLPVKGSCFRINKEILLDSGDPFFIARLAEKVGPGLLLLKKKAEKQVRYLTFVLNKMQEQRSWQYITELIRRNLVKMIANI